MIVKIHKVQDDKKIVAICDEELLGKKYVQGKIQLDLTANFYKGETKQEQEILKILDDTYILNLVGKKSVEFGLKYGLLTKNNIIYVNKIPHAQTILA